MCINVNFDKTVIDANLNIFCSNCRTYEILIVERVLMNNRNVREILNLVITILQQIQVQVYNTCSYYTTLLFC